LDRLLDRDDVEVALGRGRRAHAVLPAGPGVDPGRGQRLVGALTGLRGARVAPAAKRRAVADVRAQDREGRAPVVRVEEDLRPRDAADVDGHVPGQEARVVLDGVEVAVLGAGQVLELVDAGAVGVLGLVEGRVAIPDPVHDRAVEVRAGRLGLARDRVRLALAL